ncbi:hypothetical protein ANRL3_00552 [Anaerolineae bacterium]|nr:hypothetical protein ANRL3_00552 [Anaerolineae bacterium]
MAETNVTANERKRSSLREPVGLGEDASFARYADRIYETFRKLGVLRY